MSQSVVLRYQVDPGNSTQTVGEMKKEMASLSKEINNTVQGSKEYYAIVNKMADLKANFKDLREEVKALDPGEKIAAVGNIAKGAIGAYTGLTSAVSIFSGSNEELEKQLLKVNAAMGLLNGAQAVISTLDEGKRIFAALTTSTKAMTAATEEASVATKGFGTAFKAIGIGLIVSAIASLIANWDKVKQTLTDVFPWLGKIGDSFDKIKEIAYGVGNAILNFVAAPVNALVKVFKGDFSGAIDEIKKGFDVVSAYSEGAAKERQNQIDEANRKQLESSIKAKDDDIAVLKARGKDTYQIERDNLKRRLDLNKDNKDEYAKVLQEIRVLDADHAKKQEDERKKAHDKYIEDLKKRNEEIQKAEEERLKILIDANTKVLSLQQQQNLDALNEIITTGKQTTQIESDNYSERFANLGEFAVNTITATVANNKALTDSERERAENEVNINNILIKNKEAALDTTANLLKSASKLAKDGSAFSKSLAIAGTLIDTYRGAQAAFTGMTETIPGPVGIALGIAAAAAAVAGGLANIAAIKKADVSGASSSSTASSPVSYTAPPVPTSTTLTRLDAPSISDITNANSQKPIQVNVGISEVTNTQNRVSGYETASSMG
jgi:hypothetical protein